MADGSRLAVIDRDPPRASVVASMAARYGMEPGAFEATLRATVVPNGCTREQFAAFLLVALEYRLNPVTREIFALPGKGGGIQTVVSVDGWMNLMNSHPAMNGLEFEDRFDGAKLIAITARIWRKDRDKPVEVTEYMSECRRDTPTWKQWPARMLRHKAAIQCARYAFGFSGVIDPDEAERAGAVMPPTPPDPGRPPSPRAAPSAPARATAGASVAPPSPSRPAAGPPPAPKAPPSPPPAPLDLVPEPQEPDAPVNAEAVLAHIADELDACGDTATLDETWGGFDDLLGRLSRTDRERANGLYDEHARRLAP